MPENWENFGLRTAHPNKYSALNDVTCKHAGMAQGQGNPFPRREESIIL